MGDHAAPSRGPLIPQRVRHYLYPVMLAAAGLATGYGLVTGEEAGLWVGLGAALLGNASAAAHTPAADG